MFPPVRFHFHQALLLKIPQHPDNQVSWVSFLREHLMDYWQHVGERVSSGRRTWEATRERAVDEHKCKMTEDHGFN